MAEICTSPDAMPTSATAPSTFVRSVAAVEVQSVLQEREAARRRQELKEKLEAQRRKRDEEAERMMDDGGSVYARERGREQ